MVSPKLELAPPRTRELNLGDASHEHATAAHRAEAMQRATLRAAADRLGVARSEFWK